MSIKQFINTAFKDYADYDNNRNIPHLMDGLKISQRKILWTFIKDIGNQEIIVDRAAMRAAAFTFYKHGGQNLYDVITKMAQNFPGSNNVNLLEPNGQFGTRMINDASSPRYIKTKLNDNYKKLFDSEDFDILKPLIDEGEEVEPAFLLPKLPLSLINGSSGVGNGFAATYLQYNPKDIAKAVLDIMKYGEVKTKLTPWIKGFKGVIYKHPETQQVLYSGMVEKVNSNTLVITELPPKYELDGFKKILNALVEEKVIKDYENESTEKAWRFVIDAPRSVTSMEIPDLLDLFGLIQKETETLTAWLPDGNIRAYRTIEELLFDWVSYRLDYYETRRLNQIAKLDDEITWLSVKLKFINWWNSKADELVKLKKDDLRSEIMNSVTTHDEFVDRLMNTRIYNLSSDQVQALEDEINALTHEQGIFKAMTNVQIMTDEVKSLKL